MLANLLLQPIMATVWCLWGIGDVYVFLSPLYLTYFLPWFPIYHLPVIFLLKRSLKCHFGYYTSNSNASWLLGFIYFLFWIAVVFFPFMTFFPCWNILICKRNEGRMQSSCFYYNIFQEHISEQSLLKTCWLVSGLDFFFGEIVTCWALIIITPRFSSCLGFYYFLLQYFFHYSTSSLPPTLLLFFWSTELKLSLAEVMVCSCAHHLLIPDTFPLFMLST